MIRSLILLAALTTAPPSAFEKVDEVDGILVEQRKLDDSPYVELQLTAVVDRTPQALCRGTFGTGKFDSREADLKSRKVLFESESERVTYDMVSVPVLSDRDYAVRTRWHAEPDGRCIVETYPAPDLAPAAPKGVVRIERVHTFWEFAPLPGGSARITYRIHVDPGGGVPAWLVEGSRRKTAVKWMKLIVERAGESG